MGRPEEEGEEEVVLIITMIMMTMRIMIIMMIMMIMRIMMIKRMTFIMVWEGDRHPSVMRVGDGHYYVGDGDELYSRT